MIESKLIKTISFRVKNFNANECSPNCHQPTSPIENQPFYQYQYTFTFRSPPPHSNNNMKSREALRKQNVLLFLKD